MIFPAFNLNPAPVSSNKALPQGPVDTGKSKHDQSKHPSVLSSAAQFARVSRKAGQRGFLFAMKQRKVCVPGSRNHFIEKAISEGLAYRDGKIYRPSGEAATLHESKTGYLRISLYKKCFNHARIVCWLVHGRPPFQNAYVDHINRNRKDDRPENLRWVSASENSSNVSKDCRQERIDRFHRSRTYGEQNPRAKLTRLDVTMIRESPKSARQLARELGMHHSTILSIRKGARWPEKSMNPPF